VEYPFKEKRDQDPSMKHNSYKSNMNTQFS